MTTQIDTVSTDTTISWAPTLESLINFVPIISIMESIVGSIVLGGFFNGYFGAVEFVYGGIVMMMSMLYIASGYLVTKSVDAGVSFVTGFYYNYAGASQWGDRLAIYEAIILGGWIFWSLFQAVAVTYIGSEAWSAVEARVAEAKADSIGLEDAMRWDLAIKSVTLMMIVGVVHTIVAIGLGMEAPLTVGWFDQYADDTKTEGKDKETNKFDADGTAAEEDILFHLITSIAAMFVLGCSNFGAYGFFLEFININGDDGFQCDVESANQSAYSGVASLAKQMVSVETCQANIQKIFDIIDTDNDGFMSRCEDAKFQYVSGSTKAYALKFSSSYTRASANQICLQDFS